MFLNHQRAVAVAHARAAWQQQIFVPEVGVGMDRDRRNMQLAAQRLFVQRLNILEPVFETITPQIDFIRRHRVKHESVVRIG